MNKSLRIFAFAFFGVAVGCVVIPDTFDANINVTIRHIEEQADDFWDEVEEDADSSARKLNEHVDDFWDDVKEDANSSEDKADGSKLSYLERAINFLSPIQMAYAAEGGGASPRLDQIGPNTDPNSLKGFHEMFRDPYAGGGIIINFA